MPLPKDPEAIMEAFNAQGWWQIGMNGEMVLPQSKVPELKEWLRSALGSVIVWAAEETMPNLPGLMNVPNAIAGFELATDEFHSALLSLAEKIEKNV